MIARACVACLLFVSALAFGQAPPSPEAPVVIRAGKLFDARSGNVLSDQVIVVANGTIGDVGPAARVAVPPGARVIDLSAYTVLPGFIDTHTHVTSPAHVNSYEALTISQARYVAYGATYARRTLLAGFTTTRDVGASGYTDVALRDAINAHELPGPHLYVSGPGIGITGGHCDDNLLPPEMKQQADGVADGTDGVRVAVRRNVKHGVDLIKFCATGGVFSKGDTPGGQQYTAEEAAALVDEAHMHGRKVAAHAHGAAGIKNALRAGVDSIEHASLIDDEGIALAIQKKAFLGMDIYNTDYTQTEGRKHGELEEFLRKDAEIGEVQRENFRKAVRAGARMTYATDGGVYPNGDNAKQFAVMVRYGMTPTQALQAATINGAELLGLAGKAGILAKGAHADIIAVKGDPLADVRTLESMAFVMKDGEVYRGTSAMCLIAGSPLGCDFTQ